MGQLTFQATLGGAVNLAGPNTATTTTFTLPAADGTNGQFLSTNGSGTLSFASSTAQVYPGAGIANSTGSAWGTSYSTTGSGTVVALATSPTFVTPILGTPTSATLTNATGLPLTTGVTGTLPVANGGTGLPSGTSGGVLAYTASGTLASSAALTQYGIVYGGGAGAVPVATAAGTTGQVLTATTGSAPTWATVSTGLTLGTPVDSTSGTSITFTGIPAGVKQITISFLAVSTDGTGSKVVRIGDSGGIETADYASTGSRLSTTGVGSEAVTGGFNINTTNVSNTLQGSIILTLLNSSTNTWAAFGSFADIAISNLLFLTAGTKSLTGTLDRVSITSTSGSENFDNGQINIAYF